MPVRLVDCTLTVMYVASIVRVVYLCVRVCFCVSVSAKIFCFECGGFVLERGYFLKASGIPYFGPVVLARTGPPPKWDINGW